MSIAAESAIARHERYLQVDPNNALLLTALGDLYHGSGRYDEALACFRKCLSLDPQHAVALGRVAGVLISQHRFADAERALRPLCESHPSEAALHYNLGLALYYQQRWADALAAFDHARQQGLDHTDLLRYRAYALHHLARFDDAIVACNEWLARDSTSSARGYLAVLEMDKGDLPAAYARAEELLKADPDNTDATLVAGMYLTEHQDIERARAHFEKLLALEPDNARGWFGIGLTHMYLEEHAEAVAALEKALAVTPDHVGTLVTLGWAKFTSRDWRGAEEVFRRAVAADRTFGEAHGGLAVTLVFQKRRAEARREAALARKLNPHGFGAVWAHGALLALEGKREQGEAEVAAALNSRVTSDGLTLFEHVQIFLRGQAARAKLKAPPRISSTSSTRSGKEAP